MSGARAAGDVAHEKKYVKYPAKRHAMRSPHLLPLVHTATMASSALLRAPTMLMRTSLRIAVVGDTHEQYDEEDNEALINLQPDAVLFVGDFGNEDVDAVSTIARLQDSLPCASVFGNHDVTRLTKLYRNKKLPQDSWAAPSEGGDAIDDNVDDNGGGAAATAVTGVAGSNCEVQLALRPRFGLGKEYSKVREMHLLLERSNCGWGRRDFGELGLSVAGGRPFSSGGGDHLAHKKSFYEDLFLRRAAADSGDFGELSARRIARSVDGAPRGFATVVLAHNGPTGLGGGASDIVGRDWTPRGRKKKEDPTDWGDEDLERGLAACRTRVPLVVFGHMHHALRHGGERQAVRQAHGRVYVNAACVPRWRRSPNGRERAFTMVELTRGAPQPPASARAAPAGVAPSGSGGSQDDDDWMASTVELLWALPSGEVAERRVLWERG